MGQDTWTGGVEKKALDRRRETGGMGRRLETGDVRHETRDRIRET